MTTDVSPMPTVLCRAGEISEVILSLLTNAAQAVDSRGPDATGHVALTCESSDGFVTLTVTDDGCGIAPEIRDRVYDPFFTTRPVGTGLGQGLTVARVVAERHHGSVHFESRVGVGTVFRLKLPVDGGPS